MKNLKSTIGFVGTIILTSISTFAQDSLPNNIAISAKKDSSLVVTKPDTKFLTFDKEKFNNWVHAIVPTDSCTKHPKAQVTFIYPLGTNGIGSYKIPNQFSLNTHWGVNGGVKGFEFGGLLNVNKGDVAGVQIAGIANSTLGKSEGIILSGISNFATGDARGVHMAGIANTYKGKSEGIFLAGITNISADTALGTHIAGIGNFAYQSTLGMQIAYTNITRKSLIGMQIGFLNYAKNVHGTQIGFLNISDTISKGCPIGFLNIVRHGLYEFELTGGEFMSHLNFKVGTDRFYTIFKVGRTQNTQPEAYTAGIGWGTYLPLAAKHKIGIDASANGFIQQNLDYDNNNNLMLNKLDITYKWQFSKHFSLMAGPSFNHLLTEKKQNTSIENRQLNIPPTIYSTSNQNNKNQFWLGFSAGIAFKL